MGQLCSLGDGTSPEGGERRGRGTNTGDGDDELTREEGRGGTVAIHRLSGCRCHGGCHHPRRGQHYRGFEVSAVYSTRRVEDSTRGQYK